MFLKIAFIIISTSVFCSKTYELQKVSDDELLTLLKSNDYLLVLFEKPNCELCTKYANELISLKEDLENEHKCNIATASNSHLVRLYSPTKEPALVYFRHGVPALFNGEPSQNDIYEFIQQNKQPSVKELSDEIFEHMTQAATGATTGDWLVMFYSASCIDCQRLQAIWEGVGATLKGRVNVARVDAAGAGVKTAKRFKVTSMPTFILFRLGKAYRYDLPKRDIVSFVSFAQDWYKNAKSEPVTLLESPFDELVNWCVATIRFFVNMAVELLEKHPWIWQVAVFGAFGFCLVALTAIIAIYKANKSKSPPKETKKKTK